MSDRILHKTINILLFVLMGVSVVFLIFFYFGGTVEGTAGTAAEEPIVAEGFIIWAYILLGLALFFTLIFPTVRMILNPKNAKKTGIGLVGLAVLVFIAFQVSSDEPLRLATESDWNTPTVVKWSGAGLGTMYALIALAFLSILYTEISRFFK